MGTKRVMQPRDRRECRFLFVGQGVQRKGLHHLLRAWRRINLADAELTIVATTLDLGIAKLAGKNVRILPRQSAEQLRNLFASSHVFAMPSLVEGFGLVYLEALGAGCHCIGTANTGLPDLLRFFTPDVSAMSLIEAGDIDQLGAALESAYTLHRTGCLDHDRIAELAQQITWKSFRSSVAALARQNVDIGSI